MCNFNISIDFLSDVWYDTYVVVYCVEAVIILIRKIFALSLAFILLFGTFLNVNAAKKSDMLRVYKALISSERFSEVFGFSEEIMDLYGVDGAYVSLELKKLINDIIDIAVIEKNEGNLNEDNLREELKGLAIARMVYADPAFLAMVTELLNDKEYSELSGGEIPDRFKSISAILYPELKRILGYGDLSTRIIFDDMESHLWACNAVDYLFNLDVVNGVSDFMYAPADMVTREQFTKLICSAFDIKLYPGTTVSFSDTDKNAWYYPYIEKMVSNGLIKGVSNELFGVGNNITRQDMAVIMYRVGEYNGLFTSKHSNSPFIDTNEISSYALNAVNSLKEYGILKGDDTGKFNPKSNATRAEAAQMIYNMLMYIENPNQ